VTLFIHRLPFHVWIDNSRTPPLEYWSIRLPVIVTDVDQSAPPANAQAQDWVLDTGNTGAAFAWRQHLVAASLDPEVGRVGTMGIT
jgi:hypothetical protein